ncbi:polycomb group protein ASXL1 isoform X2 [Xenopus tropicalis]|uniref:Polycomb group protein ASXL1 isoform X2 n=1 Tax=Xenopus tropicalis TaxID=8364 RepID=A0A8J1IXD3_XENTR|nr:polycomb group protein ASXL1 isoform X2 [Xenopus tropicalis]
MRDKQKRRRERTWAEAARMVLENYSDAPMTPKQILHVIESEGLKETNTGSSPLACLNAMLHSNSRTREALFYKLPGRISLFTMKKNALQWSRAVPASEDGDTEDPADTEGAKWSEGKVPSAEACIGASCSRELHCRETRSLVQMNKQKRRSAVLLPRVVLTPLKVNGAHLPSTSGLSVHRGSRESSRVRAVGGSLSFQRRAAFSRDGAHPLRGIRGPGPGQVRKSRVEEIDFETPGSILVNTNLRALMNLRTFNALSTNLQQQLLLLLPDVDRQVSAEGQIRMSPSALNNEFFAHACQRWRERLADGELTPEMQLRIRQEMGREKKVEGWKEKFFEEFYGQKSGLAEEHFSDEEEKNGRTESRRVPRGAQIKATEARPGDMSVPRQERRVKEIKVTEALPKDMSVPRQDRGVKERKATEAPPKDVSVPGQDRRGRITRGKEGKEETGAVEVSPEMSESPTVCVMGAGTEPGGAEAHIAPNGSQNLPTFPDRVPAPHPHSSEQKRKMETESYSPSVEKKPRMEQRRSFRNTIQSVYTEKPQPTKEEPKVPPIRIQLSRIKPPWVYKGLPAQQSYPRIIPNPDPPGGGPPPRSPPDSQTSAIGGGGGPGGGRTIKARKESWKREVRQPTKRDPTKPRAGLFRTQLLSPTAIRNSLSKALGKRGTGSGCSSPVRTELGPSACSVIGKANEFSMAGASANGLSLSEVCAARWAYEPGTDHGRDSVQPSNVTSRQRKPYANPSAVGTMGSVPCKASGHGSHVGSFTGVLDDVSNMSQSIRKQHTVKRREVDCTPFPVRFPPVSLPGGNYRNVQTPSHAGTTVAIYPKVAADDSECAVIGSLSPTGKILPASTSRFLSKIPVPPSDYLEPTVHVLPAGQSSPWGKLIGHWPQVLVSVYKSLGELNPKCQDLKRRNFQALSGTLAAEASVSAPLPRGFPDEDLHSWAAGKIQRYQPVARGQSVQRIPLRLS